MATHPFPSGYFRSLVPILTTYPLFFRLPDQISMCNMYMINNDEWKVHCLCAQGLTGDYCEKEHNQCKRNPCRFDLLSILDLLCLPLLFYFRLFSFLQNFTFIGLHFHRIYHLYHCDNPPSPHHCSTPLPLKTR